MRLVVLLVLALLAPTLAGCATSASNGPAGQTAGGSGPGGFSKAGNHAGATKTERVTWTNEGATAAGSLSTNVASGVARFEMLDGAGRSVWSETVTMTGQTSRAFTTDAGKPGTWTFVVSVTAFTGQYAVEGHAA